MVSGQQTAGNRETVGPVADHGGLMLRVDGSRPLSAETVSEVGAVCDRAEDGDTSGFVIIYLSGVPVPEWPGGLSVALVSKWERAMRRLERLPAVTIAVAEGDCGGSALDALLAADYRIIPAGAKLVVPVVAGATWPGMALYRLCHQAGAAAVRAAVLFGAPIEADTALALRLLDEVADHTGSALATAVEMTNSFSGSELAIRRQLMLDAVTVSFEDALGRHLASCDRQLRRISAGLTP